MILPTPELNAADTARAVAAGPPWAATSVGYPILLDKAGFVDIQEHDMTAQYRETAADWLHESIASAADLEALIGIEEYRSGLADRRNALAAIDDGLLTRALFTARAG